MPTPDLPYAKPVKGTAARQKAKRRRALLLVDGRESEKVRERSGGRCEVVVRVESLWGTGSLLMIRCFECATQVHHMIGGVGVRARGESAKAIRKQHVCDRCHQDITGDVGGKKLIREGGPVPHYTDCYRRVR